jgi:hypothetical protein
MRTSAALADRSRIRRRPMHEKESIFLFCIVSLSRLFGFDDLWVTAGLASRS